ncbi:MAG: hypothetical protein IJ842_06435 [Bacilli bacterium]|nr:hypothetical protein [Bacilli bacterium]
MKLKKKVKRIILIVLVVVLLILVGLFIYNKVSNKKSTKEVKIVNEVEKYGYKLKENKPTKYKKMFEELKKILSEENVNEEDYVKKISEMFIYDFYSLSDKTAKTDVGGVDFVYPDVLENFLLNAQNTYYKYVESNIYKNRNQSLPTVGEIEVVSAEKTPFAYGDKTDENAYKVKVKWDYTDSEFDSYQKEADLIFIHEDNKLHLVELQ